MTTAVPATATLFSVDMNNLGHGMTLALAWRTLAREYVSEGTVPCDGHQMMEFFLLLDDLYQAAAAAQVQPPADNWLPVAGQAFAAAIPAVPAVDGVVVAVAAIPEVPFIAANPLGGRAIAPSAPTQSSVFPHVAAANITHAQRATVTDLQAADKAVRTRNGQLKTALEKSLDVGWINELKAAPFVAGVKPYGYWSAKELFHAAAQRYAHFTEADRAAAFAAIGAAFTPTELASQLTLNGAIRRREQLLLMLPDGYGRSYASVRHLIAQALRATPAGTQILMLVDIHHPGPNQTFDQLYATVTTHYDTQVSRHADTASHGTANAADGHGGRGGKGDGSGRGRGGRGRGDSGGRGKGGGDRSHLACNAWLIHGKCDDTANCPFGHPEACMGAGRGLQYAYGLANKERKQQAAARAAKDGKPSGSGKASDNRSGTPRRQRGKAAATESTYDDEDDLDDDETA